MEIITILVDFFICISIIIKCLPLIMLGRIYLLTNSIIFNKKYCERRYNNVVLKIWG